MLLKRCLSTFSTRLHRPLLQFNQSNTAAVAIRSVKLALTQTHSFATQTKKSDNKTTQSIKTTTPLPSYQTIMNNPYAGLQATEKDPNILTHSIDRYSGVTVPDTTLQAIETPQEFERLLKNSLASWTTLKRRGLWLQVPIEKSAFIPAAAAEGFQFHHAQPKYVMMTCWLPHRTQTVEQMAEKKAPQDGLKTQHIGGGSESGSSSTESKTPAAVAEPSMIPDYATHSLGIGCVVLNSKGEVLVIQEKFAHPLLPDFWKLSGGAIDVGEDIPTAAEREVLEETGIQAKFQCLIGFRHLLNFRFGTGDLYFICICTLKDEANCTPIAQPEEISAVKWWDFQEFSYFHSSRWFQDLIREPVLQEWKRLFPDHTLPPAPTPERIKELATLPPHPKAAEGKTWPTFDIPHPPPPGVGMRFAKIQSPIGNIVSNFYVVSPPPSNAASSSSTASKL